jgi:Mn2+/Fe2+ NRAMP family transporter
MSEASKPQARNSTSNTVESATLEAPVSLFRALRQIGPGLILAGAIVGTGELIATTNLGAKAGFALLWLVIVSCFIKVFVQIELGRYTISSGESAFEAFKRLPGPGILLVWWCAAMLLVTQTQIGAMIGGIAQAVFMVAPLPKLGPEGLRPDWPWALLITVVTIGMLGTGSYRLVERVSTVLVAGFTIMTVACVVLLPAEHAVTANNIASGLRFAIPTGAIVAAFTMFGITGVGASELLAYPSWCLEKGYARHVGPRDEGAAWAARARGWLRVLRLDAWFCMIIYTVATLAFYLLGAAVLHKMTGGAGLEGKQTTMIQALVQMYAPVLGPKLATYFVVFGTFCVLYSTLFAATAGNSRLLADFLCVNRFVNPDRSGSRKGAIRVLCGVLPLLGFVLYLTFGDLVGLVTVGAVMQGLTLPFIGAAAVYLRYQRSDHRITPGVAWDVFLWLSVLGLTLAATYTVCDKLGIKFSR